MYVRRETPVVAMALLGIAAVFACSGGASGGGSDNMVEFPSVSMETLDNLCIRGELSAPGQKAGEIDAGDCDPLDVFGISAFTALFEAYRVRVNGEAAIPVSFQLSSSFSSTLQLYRVNDVSDYVNSLELLGSDPDFVEHSLEPGTEYIIFIVGDDDTQLGGYSLFLDDG